MFKFQHLVGLTHLGMKQVFLITWLCLSLKVSSAEQINGFEFGDNTADKHFIENDNGHIILDVPVKF